MKVIFLDIDGVMNSENRLKALKEKVNKGQITEDYAHKIWDLPSKETLIPLQRIVQETGAIIVLSSSWRHYPSLVKKLNKIFSKYGFSIYDQTCDGVKLEELKTLGFDPDKCYDAKFRNPQCVCDWTRDRGAEIAKWLSEHKDVESFVIIDDDWADINPYYPKQYVQTYFYDDWGLTEEKATEAINILNKNQLN